MTNVFNAQDDAVVVVQQDQSYNIEAQEMKIQESQQDVPSFMFSNRKSVELFGSDLQNLRNDDTDMLQSFLDLKKFVCIDQRNNQKLLRDVRHPS